jgi:BirA family transcriptional regulator, biotin operon repressor / biotin---[acetyl-CoA-carboxylase] ligase
LTLGASPRTAASPPGWRIARFDSLGSTNDEARNLALSGDPGRVWILAGEQTQGRGRHGRQWSSPGGNLYASALLVDPAPIALAAQIGFVAGIALQRAVADLGANGVRLKWPNDLVHRGAKLAGLLAEGVALGAGRFASVIGFGVNCASSPGGLAYPTTSLSAALGRPVLPEQLLHALAPRFDEALRLWSAGAGFAAVRAAWLDNAAGLGAPIRIAGCNSAREGLFETLDAQGRLVMRKGDGLETIDTGDLVFLQQGESASGGCSVESTNRQ